MARQKTNPYYRGPQSDHFDGVRFFVPNYRAANGLADFLKWKFNGQRQKWPRSVDNPEAGGGPQPRHHRTDGLALTWIGHATVLIQTGGLNILTDPFFSWRTSPVQWAGPKRTRPPALNIDALPPIDVILLSHNHYDHMDMPALKALRRRFDCRIVTPLGNGAILARASKRLAAEEGDWGDRFALGSDVAVTLTPALHWSKRTPWDRNMALWSAFVIEGPGGPVYFAADTGFGDGQHFRAVRDRFGPPRATLMPIGAYEPRWFMKAQHVNPDEAVRAHLATGAAYSMAIHHSTVQLTDEAIDQPAKELAEALDRHKVQPDRFQVAPGGEPVSVPPLPARGEAVLESDEGLA